MDSVELRWSPDESPGSGRKDWYEAVHAALRQTPGTLIGTLAKGADGWTLESVAWGLGTREGGVLSFDTQTDLQERELAAVIVAALRRAGKNVSASPRLANVPCFSNNVPDPVERARWDTAVQAGLQAAVGKIASYSVTAAQHTGTIEVMVTVPGKPRRDIRVEFREGEQTSVRVAEVLRGMLAAAGL